MESGEATGSGSHPAVELSVIAPCLDERLNLPELTRRVLGTFERGALSGELVLVDDGSTDGSDRMMTALVEAHPGRVVVVRHPVNRGIAAAWRSGAEAARGRLVATIDADLQYQPEDLLRLHRTLSESSVDLVQGHRSPVGRRRDERYTLSRGLNALLNGVFSMDLRDNKSGFVMCAREVFLDLLSYRGHYRYWQSFVMVAAHAKGYSYREVEALFEERRQGVSFLAGKNAFLASARSLVDIGRAAIEYRVRSPGITSRAERASPSGPPPIPDDGRSAPLASPPASPDPIAEARWKVYLATFDRTHWMITRDVERHHRSLSRTQWLSRADLDELADEKLRRLIRHAYRNVPFYRARMQELRLRPEDIRGRQDLSRLPLLTKKDVRDNLYFDILSENHDKDQVQRVVTSGSTGEPFVCFADRQQLEFRWAATLRAQEWTGYRFGDPTVRLWHQTVGMTPSQIARERADALMSRRTFVPVFDLDDRRIEQALETIARVSPTLLDGYAEALDLLSRFVAARPELAGTLRGRVGGIMSSAQTLPERSRRVIEEAFGCRVFDKYGSREFSGIAYECEAHDGHHVVDEGYIVEILKDGRPALPGELGEVVVTDLQNRVLPFLRYRIGDLAVQTDETARCACGRQGRRVGAIEGRVQSIVVGSGGRFLPGSFFAHYLKEFDHAIARYQVVQEREGAIVLRVKKGGRYSPEVMDEILTTLHEKLGRETHIEVELVDGVDMVATGKIVPVVSRLGIDFQRPGLASAAEGETPGPATSGGSGSATAQRTS